MLIMHVMELTKVVSLRPGVYFRQDISRYLNHVHKAFIEALNLYINLV